MRGDEHVLVGFEMQHRTLLEGIELKWVGHRQRRHARGKVGDIGGVLNGCLLYTSPSPRDS